MMRSYSRREVTEALEHQIQQAEGNIAWAERVGIPRANIRDRLLSLSANGRGSLRSGPNGSGRGIDRLPVEAIKVRVRELHTENQIIRERIGDAENKDWLATVGR